MDFFKSLTFGVKFSKPLTKRSVPAVQMEIKKEVEEDLIPIKRKKVSEEYKKCSENEVINKLRKQHCIKVKGIDEKEKPIESFDELFRRFEIHEQLIKNLVSLNYQQPTPVQMQCLPLFLKQMELKVTAPTGSGKSLAFAVPLIQNILSNNKREGIQALIIVPTRELATQILSVTTRLCVETGVRAHIITSTNEEKMKKFHKKKTDILISTPMKLNHFIASSSTSLKHVEWIVIDEVDKLFEESNQKFQDDLEVILEACDNPKRKFALFSATTSKSMTSWVHEKLKTFATINISPNLPVSTIKQELKYVGTEAAKLQVVRDIVRDGIQPPILIFLQSKDRAKQLFSELVYDGLNIDIIHSDRNEKERNEVYRKFREGKIWILICTELMSRGIDFRNISMVINYDLPTSTTSYVHRVGRVGRAGAKVAGKAITFYTNEDNKRGLLRDIAKMVVKSGSYVEPFLLQLKKSNKKERVALLKKAPKRKIISTKINLNETKRKKKKMKKIVESD